MAPINTLDTTTVVKGALRSMPGRSILSLDKSEDPFEEQISEACSTLGIDLGPPQEELEVVTDLSKSQEQGNFLHGPRYEWTLKWLLKKLRVDTYSGSPSLCPKAWLLLRFLVAHTHPAKVAQLLTSNKYTDILRRTLAWLQNNPIASPTSIFEYSSDSSSGERQRTKKRKREVAGYPTYDQTSETVKQTNTLILSICGSLLQLQSLLDFQSLQSQPVVAEQLKIAMRCVPEEAASIIGNGFYLMNHTWQRAFRIQTLNKDGIVESAVGWLGGATIKSCAEVLIKFWEIQLHSCGSEVDQSRFQAFTKFTMLSSLLLLHTCRNVLTQDEPLDAIAGKIESLIAMNVVVPMQKSFRAIARNSFSDLNEALIKTFRFSPFPHSSKRDWSLLSSKDWAQQAKAEMYLATTLMCSFFEIAVACHPRASPKARKEEDSFLKRLLNELKNCAEFKSGPKSSNSLPRAYSRALANLLERAVKHSVTLDVSTIESILEQSSGLFESSSSQRVEWTLISLCLENNADVFTIPTGAPSGIFSYKKPNKFLTSLLVILNEKNDKPSAESDQLYNLKSKKILIPLLHAFANTRDLPGFLEHWKEQLNNHLAASQHVLSNFGAENACKSPWEDDDFLHAAQELIEPMLSAGQLDVILNTIESHLWKLNLDNNGSFNASELVILDCIFAGCRGEDLKIKLSVRARSIYKALAEAPLKSSRAYGSHRWRLWRILATIDWKWPSYKDGLSSIETTRKVVEKAFVVLNETTRETDEDLAHTYQEQSYAFSVMTTLALFDYIWTKTTEFSFKKMLEMSVATVLDLKDRFCHQLSEDIPGLSKPLENLQGWNGKGTQIQCAETLYLSCFAQLLSHPPTLSCLDTSTQKRMLEQLSQLARWERDAMASSRSDVDCSWLWARLQHCEALNEDLQISRSLCDLRYRRYKSALGSEDPVDWKVDSVDYAMAFEGLQDETFSHFNSEHRIGIANRLVDVLVGKKDLALQIVAKHLQLLTKFADTRGKPEKFKKTLEKGPENPSVVEKSMTVFQNIKMDDDTLQERSAVFVLAEMVNRKAWSAERPACEDALCRLTRIILRYVYTSIPHDPSAIYFTMFYQWIGGEMERASTTRPMCHSDWPSSSCMLLVTMTALNYYHENRERAIQTLGPQVKITDKIRHQHFERVVSLLDTGLHDWKLPKDRRQLAAILECLYGYLDLLATQTGFLAVCKTLSNTIDDIEHLWSENQDDQRCHWDICGHSHLRARFFKIAYKFQTFESRPYEVSGRILMRTSKIQGGDERSVLRYFQEFVPTLDPENIDRLLGLLPTPYQFHLIYGLTEGQAVALQPCLTRKFVALCNTVQRTKINNGRETILAMRFLNLLLQRLPQFVSQHLIDSLLSTIATSASQMKTSPSFHTAKYHVGLTRLFGTTLTLQRTKMGGRYHLILPALQSLLRLLFVPYASTTNPAEPTSAFKKTHASAYARLLTTLCDPSPSAVARPGHHQQAPLNDETKRAKSIAGQHLHYLIMTYCECQLQGRLAAEGMREVLEPGLWAVVGCMGHEVMRTMNAGMDSSGRAVWKRLYEDWKKFGQWQGG